jgi:hypothetical protein
MISESERKRLIAIAERIIRTRLKDDNRHASIRCQIAFTYLKAGDLSAASRWFLQAMDYLVEIEAAAFAVTLADFACKKLPNDDALRQRAYDLHRRFG